MNLLGMAMQAPGFTLMRQRGPNLLVDGDCEAVGVAAYTATNATLTKETTDPYEGQRVLRVTATDANANASQSILTIGKQYWITGVGRGDGTGGIVLVWAGNVNVFTGTTSTSYQKFSAIFTAASAVVRFYCSVSGHYCDYDNLYLSLVG